MAYGINTATQYSAKMGPYTLEIGYVASSDVTSNIGSADISETHCVPTRLTHVIGGVMYSQCDAGDGFLGCTTGTGPVYDCTGGLTAPDSTAVPQVCFTLDTSCSGAGGDYYLIVGW
jgi:hypothetical protein